MSLPSRSLVRSAAVCGAVLLLPAVARADVLVLNDGRQVEGAVEKVGEAYRVRSRFGEATLPASEVKTWTKAKPVDDQIRERLQELSPDDAENRVILAEWLKDLGRDEEARTMAQAVLEIDPENARAHAVLGHVRHQGVWRTPDEAKKAEGLELHGDRWYSKEEWQSLSDEKREKVAAEEKKAETARIGAEVNEAVRLMMSPDPLVQKRGRARIEALAASTSDARLKDLPKQVDDMIAARDRLEEAYQDSVESASVLSELRVTFTKLVRPIQIFETSLASGPIGAAAPVRIQLPELQVIRVNTTVSIPAKKK
jgi:hypothetical protein